MGLQDREHTYLSREGGRCDSGDGLEAGRPSAWSDHLLMASRRCQYDTRSRVIQQRGTRSSPGRKGHSASGCSLICPQAMLAVIKE